MPDADENLVHLTQNALWLPPGSRAEVVRLVAPVQPMCIVRLLLRDADQVFCVRRADGRLDLPMTVSGAADLDGDSAIHSLAESVVGEHPSLRFVGAVRNVVDAAHRDYPWPTPFAYFGVWAADGAPRIDGTWVSVRGDTSSLSERHWYPLL